MAGSFFANGKWYNWAGHRIDNDGKPLEQSFTLAVPAQNLKLKATLCGKEAQGQCNGYVQEGKDVTHKPLHDCYCNVKEGRVHFKLATYVWDGEVVQGRLSGTVWCSKTDSLEAFVQLVE